MDSITLATRESLLALWQANQVKAALEIAHPGLQVNLKPMTSKGDQVQDVPLRDVGGKGLFVKNLEVALLEGHADIAVHSLKDVPSVLEAEFTLAAFLPRGAAQDVLVSHKYNSVKDLPQGACVGTSSPRRQSWLLSQRSDLKIKTLRGNIITRLGKLEQGQYDAIVLAKAGIERLRLDAPVVETFSSDVCPAGVGQGIVAVECLSDDAQTIELMEAINDKIAMQAALSERTISQVLAGDCHSPIGTYACQIENGSWQVTGFVGSLDGTQTLQVMEIGVDAISTGKRVAEKLIEQGAREVLACAS
jgi:hydroxymethylbilane synthase